MSNSRKAYLTFFILLTLFFGCSSAQKNPLLGQDPDIVLSKNEYSELSKNASKLWMKRYQASTLLEFIHLNEKIARSAEAGQEDLVKQARAYFLLGEYFSNTQYDRERNWVNAANWAEKALTLNQAFRKLPSLDALQAKDADALYWLGASLANYASEDDLKGRVRMMMDRVESLAPNTYFAGVNRFYGVYYSMLHDATAEDLKQSRENFEKALKRSPEFFANHVSFARFYAKKTNDRLLFKQQLQAVMKTNARDLKEFYPEQFLERNRAKFLISEGHL